ncbi:MAG TPA: serine/threonine protein kinase, partial [Comamonadaceae bacterium]|nr:serine/threonine protein kinase [Comamonadaceae bacterium]
MTTPPPDTAPPHPYATLTPDLVLDALAGIGLYGDGRLMALGSYENRVYQAVLEDGSRVVAKFYRPGRWSDAQILEEHAFAQELAAAEVPMVAPLAIEGSTQ